MRSLIIALFTVVSFNTVALETATQPDFASIGHATAEQQQCMDEALADESGYELDESEVQEYCRPSNY